MRGSFINNIGKIIFKDYRIYQTKSTTILKFITLKNPSFGSVRHNIITVKHNIILAQHLLCVLELPMPIHDFKNK